MNPTEVAVYKSAFAAYPREAPFPPQEKYPECPFPETGREPNAAYEGVREVFRIGGLDRENFGTSDWNPLRSLIRPRETVLLKPNLIKERHPRDPQGWQYVLTQGSIVRAVADFVWKALDGKGHIILADAPQTDSSFQEIVRTLGLDSIRDFYRAKGLTLELVDLRREEWVNREGVIVSRQSLDGDPRGNVAFDLGDASEFATHKGAGRYYGADYDAGEVNRHHSGGRHEYLLAASAIQCDVVFNLPKLKTHKKAGITVALKNLVGINGDKNWLPHHTEGAPAHSGDEHPSPDVLHRAERRLVQVFRQLSLHVPGAGNWLHRRARRIGAGIFGDTEEVIRSGNWWGNDTVWRMCLDLNKILSYGNADGSFRPAAPEHRKRHYVLVDGLIAGEGRGPMNPDPVPAGVLIFGIHPASVDAASAWLMGFDPERIPIVRQAFRCRRVPLAEWNWKDVSLICNQTAWNGPLGELFHQESLRFEPHFGWKGHI
ncbi:MAG: DUF362 domain-containing protein, partial [Terriglobales bacterium]